MLLSLHLLPHPHRAQQAHDLLARVREVRLCAHVSVSIMHGGSMCEEPRTSATSRRFWLSSAATSRRHVETENGSKPGTRLSLGMSGMYTTAMPSRFRSAASSRSSSRADASSEDFEDPIQTSHVFSADFEGGLGSSDRSRVSKRASTEGLSVPFGISRLSVEPCLSVCFASADSCVCASLALAESGEDAS